MELLLKIVCSKEQVSYLKSLFKELPVAVLEDGEDVFLRSSEIVTEEFAEKDSGLWTDTWKKARGFIAQINGAARLGRSKDWKPISLENMKVLLPDGKEKWFPISGYGTIAGPGRSLPVKEMLDLGMRDKHVAKVLRLYDRDLDWVNLYRIFEVVREDVGGQRAIEERGWLTDREMNAFTGTANNASVIGDDARHGKIASSALPSETIRIVTGKAMIKKLVTQWIEDKLDPS